MEKLFLDLVSNFGWTTKQAERVVYLINTGSDIAALVGLVAGFGIGGAVILTLKQIVRRKGIRAAVKW